MTAIIYAMGQYGFYCATDRFWASIFWPIYLGEIAASHYQSTRKGGQDDR